MAELVEGGLYVCESYLIYGSQAQICTNFVPLEQSNFLTELSSLTYHQAGTLITLTAVLFATAWLFKHLSLTAKRG